MPQIKHLAAVVCSAFLMLSVFAFQPPAAQAKDARISIKITKAGFVVGVTSGSGVLQYEGKNYPLSISGLKVGFTIGVATAQFYGRVHNLHRLSDIEGTYTSANGSAAFGAGHGSIVLENGKGVQLTLSGQQQGLEASLDVGGVAITLK